MTEGEDAGKTYDVIGVYVFVGVDEPIIPKISKQPQSAVYKINQSIKACM